MGSGFRSVSGRCLVAGVVVLCVHACRWSGGVRGAYAQPEEVRYTFALVGVPLADALSHLLEEVPISLVYPSRLVEGRTTFCKAERVTAERLLACMLEGTGLDYARLSSGTYVLLEDPRAPPLYASLTGQVLDAETGLPLAGANVLLAGESTGAATNQDGRFAFPALRPGPHRLVVTHIAYHATADTVYAGPDADLTVAVALRPRVVLSAPVVVSGFEARLPSEDLGTGRRTAEDLAAAKGIGAQDVVQHLESIVGVHLGDALSDVHVQGGASDEQQFLLDGVPVFMPVPNGGFVGPFSPFAAGQVTVRKAGFGAAHGSGLSGVIEVEHGLAPPEGRGLTAQVDPLSFNARWNGQAGAPERAEARWMLAFRKGLWDLYAPGRLEALFRQWALPDRFLFEALGAPGPSPADMPVDGLEVGFDDVHAAVRVRLGGLRSLRASLYQGHGVFGIDDAVPSEAPGGFEEDRFEKAYRWRNRTARLRYEWVQSRRLFMHAGLWTSGYRLAHPAVWGNSTPALDLGQDDFNEITTLGAQLGADWAVAAHHYVSAALEASHTDSDFALSLDPFGAAPAGPGEIAPIRWQFAGFVEDRLALGAQTTLTFGTRLTYVPLHRHLYAEPRLALQYDRAAGPRSTWAVRGALGRYRQFLHAFDVATYNETALLPRVRFWLPVGRAQRPPEAYHATAAVLYRTGPAWQFSVETYYKHQPHLLVLDYGRAGAATLSGELLRGADGYAYGAAFMASRTTRRLQVDAQYEYAVARRRVANRFGGAFVPVPWDAPHRLYLALDVHPLAHWTATLRWQHVIGRSWGFRQAYYDFLEPNPATRSVASYDLSDPGAHRLPAFSQLDVGLAYTRQVGGIGVQGRITLINVLGRTNVTDWSLQEMPGGSYARQPRRAATFIPSFSLRLSL